MAVEMTVESGSVLEDQPKKRVRFVIDDMGDDAARRAQQENHEHAIVRRQHEKDRHTETEDQRREELNGILQGGSHGQHEEECMQTSSRPLPQRSQRLPMFAFACRSSWPTGHSPDRPEGSNLPPLPSHIKKAEEEVVTQPQANDASNGEGHGLIVDTKSDGLHNATNMRSMGNADMGEAATEMEEEVKNVTKEGKRPEVDTEAQHPAEEARREEEEDLRKEEVARLKEEVAKWKEAAIRQEEEAREMEEATFKRRMCEERAKVKEERERQRQKEDDLKRKEREAEENRNRGTADPPATIINSAPKGRSNVATYNTTSASQNLRLPRFISSVRMPEPISMQELGAVNTDHWTGRMAGMSWRAVFHTQRHISRCNTQLSGEWLSNQQMARFSDARGRVIRAVKCVLGKAVHITHEALTIGADLLEYTPIPGLAPVARILLDIWDAFEQVQSSRFACIRLVERCASILLSVREEVASAGLAVIVELRHPIRKLQISFEDILKLLRNQLDTPFLRRFLGRDQLLHDIEHCDKSLTAALWFLGFSVQIRTLKLLQTSQANGLNIFGAWKQRFVSNSKVRERLEELHKQQNIEDREQDFAELRHLLRAAVQTTDDVAMVEILQIGRDEMPEAMRALEHTLKKYNSPARTTVQQAKSDDLDRRFMESGIEALRRLTSHEGTQINLPSWTISRFEISFDRRIGVGLFSNVYKGTWRNRVVAIKVLADVTPQKLFVREADIWKSLSHPNIVQLLGASSTSSEPPWFFVSPYYRNGNLVKYLKELQRLKATSALRMMYEISSGMAHLHRHGVLHGDLKAVNVLVDDDRHFVITDFGQSELKSEVYRVTQQPISRGTLRWQAPELMCGAATLTQQIDVYAFAITCVEIITKGSLPWNMLDDSDVRHVVLVRRERPSLSSSSFPVDNRLRDILHACWHRDPSSRPSFSRISRGLGDLRPTLGGRAA